MDVAELQDGFRVGEWLIEPRASRATTADRVVELSQPQARLLVALAERHGEAVARRTLRDLIWPGQPAAEERLRVTVAGLRALFGENPRQPRYIASVGHDGYALVAHFELAPKVVAPRKGDEEPTTVGQRLHWLLTELRRRNVIKVAASYLVVMWIVLQVAEVTFAPLRFPGWWMTVLTILAVLGLPIVAVLAWTYEITPQGVVLDPGTGGGGAIRMPRPRQSLAPVIVAGVALMAGVTGLAWWRSLETPVVAAEGTVPAPHPPGPKSIAVLPLVDMSPAGGNAWLGDGLSEELATRLAQVPGLRVAARTSAFEFRGKNMDVRRIGEALGVRHLLEGSVRREGDIVRVSVQLIDTVSGYQLWGGGFDRPWRDVLDLQEELSASVTEALKIVLHEDAGGGVDSASSSVEPGALDPYLRGLALLRKSGDRSALEEAARQFERAFDVDPAFARAYAGSCTARAALYRHTRDPADLAAAERSCRKAMDVAPGQTESERALAALYVTGGRFHTAIGTYRALLSQDPGNADDLMGLAQAFEGLGKLAEAEAAFRRAAAADPSYWSAHNALGGFLFAQGRMAEAAQSYRRAADLVPSSASAQNNLGAALFMQGDATGAVEAYEKSLDLEPSRSAYSNLASAYYYAGRFREAVATYVKAASAAPNDQTLWGNLADAQWQLPAARQDARESYERAIRLAERDLELGPPGPLLLAQLGYYHARIGDCSRGRQYITEAGAGGSDQMYVQYFTSLVAADCADPAALQRAAAAAVRLGYPQALLDIDPSLKGKLGEQASATG